MITEDSRTGHETSLAERLAKSRRRVKEALANDPALVLLLQARHDVIPEADDEFMERVKTGEFSRQALIEVYGREFADRLADLYGE